MTASWVFLVVLGFLFEFGGFLLGWLVWECSRDLKVFAVMWSPGTEAAV